jgi:hypothetical protein
MEARTSKGDRGSSRANKGDKYWLGVSIKIEKAFLKRGVHSKIMTPIHPIFDHDGDYVE